MTTKKEQTAAMKARRERIVDAFQKWPNLKYAAMAKRLGIPIGTFNSDVYELRKKDRLGSRGKEKNKFDVARRRRKIIELLCEDPKRSVRELATIMNESFYTIQYDRYLLNKAGLLPAGVRTCQFGSVVSNETLKRVDRADDLGMSASEVAEKLGLSRSAVVRARCVNTLKMGGGLDDGNDAERDFRRRQLEYLPNRNLQSAGKSCAGALGVRLPEEEHKRWMKIRRLKQRGYSWSANGVYRTHGESVQKTRYFLKGVSTFNKRMRERGLVTELQANGYKFASVRRNNDATFQTE